MAVRGYCNIRGRFRLQISGTSLSLQKRRGLMSSNINSGIYSFFISHLLWDFRHTSKDLGLHPYSRYPLFILPCIACHNISYKSFGNRDSYMGPLGLLI